MDEISFIIYCKLQEIETKCLINMNENISDTIIVKIFYTLGLVFVDLMLKF